MHSDPDAQTRTSRYGLQPITVSAACPTFAIRYRMRTVHVGTPAEEVEQVIRDAVAERRRAGDPAWTAELEDEAVAYALWAHAENLAEYQWVMGPH